VRSDRECNGTKRLTNSLSLQFMAKACVAAAASIGCAFARLYVLTLRALRGGVDVCGSVVGVYGRRVFRVSVCVDVMVL